MDNSFRQSGEFTNDNLIWLFCFDFHFLKWIVHVQCNLFQNFNVEWLFPSKTDYCNGNDIKFPVSELINNSYWQECLHSHMEILKNWLKIVTMPVGFILDSLACVLMTPINRVPYLIK